MPNCQSTHSQHIVVKPFLFSPDSAANNGILSVKVACSRYFWCGLRLQDESASWPFSYVQVQLRCEAMHLHSAIKRTRTVSDKSFFFKLWILDRSSNIFWIFHTLDPFFAQCWKIAKRRSHFYELHLYQKVYCPNETFLVIFKHRDSVANRDNMQKGSLLVKIAAN